MSYLVVKFIDENNATGVIHKNWLRNNDKCVRPSEPCPQNYLNSGKVVNIWPEFSIKVIYETG